MTGTNMVRTEHVVNELRRLADHGDGIGETDRRVIRKAADLLDAPEGSFHSLDTMLRIMANPKRFKEKLDILAAEIIEAKKDLAIFNILKNEMDRVRASAEWLLAQAESKLADAEAKLARAHSEAKRLEQVAQLLDARSRKLDAEPERIRAHESSSGSCAGETARGSGGDEEPVLPLPENAPFGQAEI